MSTVHAGRLPEDAKSNRVAVAGGELFVAEWGTGSARKMLGIHGITGSCVSLAPLGRRVAPEFDLFAPDLRGRGQSASLPGPFGMRAHADDCAAVIRELAEPPAVVLGHSMGAYVAVVLAATYPELVERLVLADGGLPLPLPEGFDQIDPDTVIDMVLGPAIERLSVVFPSVEDYLDFWRAHPAMDEWNDDVEAYFGYDLQPVEGGYRSRVVEHAVRVDGAQHMTEPTLIADALERIACPISLVRAPRNLINQPAPLLPDDVVAEWQTRLPALKDQMVDDVNHYTLLLGARGADAVASSLVGG